MIDVFKFYVNNYFNPNAEIFAINLLILFLLLIFFLYFGIRDGFGFTDFEKISFINVLSIAIAVIMFIGEKILIILINYFPNISFHSELQNIMNIIQKLITIKIIVAVTVLGINIVAILSYLVKQKYRRRIKAIDDGITIQDAKYLNYQFIGEGISKLWEIFRKTLILVISMTIRFIRLIIIVIFACGLLVSIIKLATIGIKLWESPDFIGLKLKEWIFFAMLLIISPIMVFLLSMFTYKKWRWFKSKQDFEKEYALSFPIFSTLQALMADLHHVGNPVVIFYEILIFIYFLSQIIAILPINEKMPGILTFVTGIIAILYAVINWQIKKNNND